MKPKDKFLAVVEAALWYVVTYYTLYSIKNDVNLYQSALIILVLAYLAAWACPLIRHSEPWKRTFGKKSEASSA